MDVYGWRYNTGCLWYCVGPYRNPRLDFDLSGIEKKIMKSKVIAKYNVKLRSHNYTLFRSADDKFVFRRSARAQPESSITRFYDGKDSGWSREGKSIIAKVLAGDIEPFWVLSSSSASSDNITDDGKCICPAENFKFNGVGCKCNGK